MVFAGLYPTDGEDYPLLREALERLKLNDASLIYEPESSVALGFGFRCGFLGMLHMEIIRERLEREYNLELLITAPSVEYHVYMHDGSLKDGRKPGRAAVARHVRPRRGAVGRPVDHLAQPLHRPDHGAGHGAARQLRQDGVRRRAARLLTYQMPLAELIVDFYDQLKTRTQGYA